MSNQPPYGYPPPPGGYQGGGYPPPGGQPGGYPPPPGGGYGYTPQGPSGKTKVMNLDYNVAGLLCYVPCCIGLIFSILFVATEPKESRFVRFHALQGLFLIGVNVILGVIYNILGAGLSAAPSGAAAASGSILLLLVQLVIGLGLLILHIVAMVKAYQNQMWKIPVIGDLAEKNS